MKGFERKDYKSDEEYYHAIEQRIENIRDEITDLSFEIVELQKLLE